MQSMLAGCLPMARAAGFFLLFSACTALGGCAAGQSLEPFAYDADLIDGTALFGATVAPAPQQALLHTTHDMQQFVARHVNEELAPRIRLRDLLQGLSDAGFFVDQYDRNATQTAADTFAARRGNCLAYTHLFMALAREAGLQASYQQVTGEPVWNVQGGYLVRNNHVNVLVSALPVNGNPRGSMTVDFNAVAYDPDFARITISDGHGASMHYGNIAVEHLQRGELQDAFAQLKRGILTHPANADLWNNLGALYAIRGRFAQAQAAHETALRISQYDKTAMAGLARVLRARGMIAEADSYAARVQYYQDRNPYYHFALAQRALLNETYDAALASVDRAIRLRRDNPRFYRLRAEVARQLGDVELAEQSMRLHGKFSARLQPQS